MGDDAAILSGVESETAAASFYSTAHGTGRVMSRTEARGRFVKDPETGKRTRQPGRVRHDEMEAWLRAATSTRRRRRIAACRNAGTVKIEHTLRPAGRAVSSHRGSRRRSR
jgi:tRNA-splicing ligase RtcB